MKNKAYYFSHDGNAHNDVKIQYLTADLGMEGYGIFWFIIEKLFDAGGILPIKMIKILSKQMNVSEAKVRTVVEAYGLFIITEESFYSQRLMMHFESRKMLSDSGKKGAKIKWGGYGEANGEAIHTPIARKEKKGNEKKEEENTFLNKGSENDFNWDSVKLYFLNSDEWMAQFCRAKLIGRDELTEIMKKFIDELELRNDYKNLKELKNHFTNWYNIQKTKANAKHSKNTGRDELLESLRQRHSGYNPQ